MASGYRYTALEEGQIRLLRMIATEPNLHAEIHVVSMDHALTYNALSYAWGNIPLFDRILINDGYIDIGGNLAAFLRHMGYHRETRVWIDAVCINQNDNDEKSR
jgi:hypothetical protein